MGDKLGDKAFLLRLTEDSDDDESSNKVWTRFSKLNILKEGFVSDYESDGFSDSDDDRMSHTQTPPPDDTKRNYLYSFDWCCSRIFKMLNFHKEIHESFWIIKSR